MGVVPGIGDPNSCVGLFHTLTFSFGIADSLDLLSSCKPHHHFPPSWSNQTAWHQIFLVIFYFVLLVKKKNAPNHRPSCMEPIMFPIHAKRVCVWWHQGNSTPTNYTGVGGGIEGILISIIFVHMHIFFGSSVCVSAAEVSFVHNSMQIICTVCSLFWNKFQQEENAGMWTCGGVYCIRDLLHDCTWNRPIEAMELLGNDVTACTRLACQAKK